MHTFNHRILLLVVNYKNLFLFFSSRANIPLMNFPEFSSAFQCPAGSPMNPSKKCRLWT